MITLSHLIAGLPSEEIINQSGSASLDNILISKIIADHRQVEPGSIFVALIGSHRDGHEFISAAISRGAAAVIGSQPLSGLPVPYLQVADTRKSLAYLSAAFFANPALGLTVIGVTGTDGKTTTSNLIYNILLAAGIRTGMISTVNAVIGGQFLDTGFHVTTPEAPNIQEYLSMMLSSGLTHVVLETTSHGLAQHRVTACEFDLAVVTNITHEHLDYHVTYQAYRDAKARLFSSLLDTGVKEHGNYRVAVLNQDDSSYEYLRSVVVETNRRRSGEEQQIKQISYGYNPGADIRAVDIQVEITGIGFTAVGPGWKVPIRSRLVGEYNIHNCLAAIALTVHGMGIDSEAAARGIAELQGIPGRMEAVSMGQDFLAIVDFAHTPNALESALREARKLAKANTNKIIAVFGSAGLRDREKRRLMAEAAIGLSNISIFTAEDPRTESVEDILDEMEAGAISRGGKAGINYHRIASRANAIRLGVHMAKPGDILIVLGKGHEQSMCFGEIEYPWDDRTALRAALAEKLHVSGPGMPALPT